MPCAAASYSCNSLITIRSPFGEMRFGAPNSAAPSPRSIWLLVRTLLVVREAFAHRKQRRALQVLDPRLLRDIGLSEADVAASGWARTVKRALRAAADRIARERLQHEGRAVDPHLLEDFAISDPEAARELRKLLGL